MRKLNERLYAVAPKQLQNLAVTYYAYKLYRREYGKKFFEALEEFDKTQWYSEEQLREYQNEKFRNLIRHAYENVPYYRKKMGELKLNIDDFKGVDDLQKMPILSREDVKKNLKDLLAVNHKMSQMVQGHTNGTTGSPLELFWDKNACRVKNVVDWRQKQIAGVKFGDKIALFLGREVVPVNKNKPPFWRFNAVFNHLLFSTYHLSMENAPIYLKKLRSFQPLAIEGYPSSLYLIALFVNELKQTLPLKAVFCSSEPLLDYQREAIEKAFECKVFDFYGMAERVVFASECEVHTGKHLNSDYGITEIHLPDGSPAPIGTLGRIVATGLHNYAMPLIRYQTSDFTAIKGGKCSCGRAFPQMENITVRDVEIMKARDGRYIIPAIMSGIYAHLTSIYELQFIQEERDYIIVNIVKKPNYVESDGEHITGELRRLFGDTLRVEIKYVESIPRTKAGKYRWMISKVPLNI